MLFRKSISPSITKIQVQNVFRCVPALHRMGIAESCTRNYNERDAKANKIKLIFYKSIVNND